MSESYADRAYLFRVGSSSGGAATRRVIERPSCGTFARPWMPSLRSEQRWSAPC
jgi:hypothetical protein